MIDYKLVTAKELEAGQKIHGFTQNNTKSYFTGFVKQILQSYVVVEKWEVGGTIEKISADAKFLVAMTEKEFKQKYQHKADDIFNNIQTKLTRDEIGYHELWNGWLSYDIYEMAKFCIENELNIVGHSLDIIPKPSFSGDMLDVALCAEDRDGDRFWCHSSLEMFNYVLKSYDKERSNGLD